MTEQIRSYLEQVMRHSGLSKREKEDWIEEMSAHLNDETSRLILSGHDENEAMMIALQQFGKPSMLRRKISHDTFGLSVPTILCLASTCLVLFFIDLYVLKQFPGSWYQRYPNTWGYLSSMLSTIPLSPSLMLAMFISFLLLFKTRCRADRAAIVLTLAIFGVLWVLVRLPLSNDFNTLLFGFKGLTTREPWVSIITGMLVLWGLLLYIWTKNQWVGLSPIIISIPVGLWSPILWFHNNFLSLFIGVNVVVRCFPIVLLVLTFKVVDKYLAHRRSLTMS
jgi:hypothetical protein